MGVMRRRGRGRIREGSIEEGNSEQGKIKEASAEEGGSVAKVWYREPLGRYHQPSLKVGS